MQKQKDIQNPISRLWTQQTVNDVCRQCRNVEGLTVERNNQTGTVKIYITYFDGLEEVLIMSLQTRNGGPWLTRYNSEFLTPAS